ncbi:hypothetical protein OsJ_06543 [Oryza sativa Japonica Group]|uniref:Helitron helicase-like domain-containing protein n=1 Tax=Oryza sativa subsp. japonica TaxID=39947 RepID=B9F5G1_ORYSJ|nr:hypothetical protein OsJ_06543 [Oryza sativa Japonica Group]
MIFKKTQLTDSSDKRKREERNKYQREWRARKKAKLSGTGNVTSDSPVLATTISATELSEGGEVGRSAISSTEKKEERNRKQREYRERKKAESKRVSEDDATLSVLDKENIDPDDPIDWLHRNDMYKRQKKKSESEIIEQNQQSPFSDGIMQCHTTQIPNVHEAIPDNDYVEFDSALFEPANEGGVDDGRVEDEQGADNDFDEASQVLEDDGYESYRVGVSGVNGIGTDDPHDRVYHKLSKTHHLLKKVPDCKHSHAIRFQFESPGFCCREGKINVKIPVVPDELIWLFTSQVHNDAKYFRKHIQYFNSHFSFTSLGETLDQRVSTAAGTGVYTFHVHGALYHRLENLVPGSQGPRHMQLYFYDTEDADALAHRVWRSPDLDINLVRVILGILAKNPYVQTFKRVGSMPNLDDYMIELNTNVTPDQRRYNAPTASQVATIRLEGDDPVRTLDRHVLVRAKGDKPNYIKAYHGCYDPLAYPFFNPNGETGWNLKMPYEDPNQIPFDVEMDETCEVPTFGNGVVDVLSSGETSGSAVGKRVVLPRSFPGGDRDMQRRFLNAMALVQRFGRPDYFITMTCNPYWDEITENLEPGQLPQDRPDLVARIFRAKLRDMLDLFVKKKYFGEVQAYAHVTEFQKRGLPHEHILLIMKSGSKLTTPDEYDKVICAEIPDKAKYPELHLLAIKHMLHGPCGTLNKNCACMVDGECRFDFPRQFNQATQQGKDSYPLYRRRDDRWRVKIRGAELDNRWVVPYNPGLLMRYNCHINVEACASIKSVKYLYKYVYKGHDCASFSVDPSGEINEIQQYINARYVTPLEAIYRMLGFPLFGIYPAVLQLQLHLPNMQYVTYNEDGNLEDVVNRPSSSRTTLTEYFKMNQVDPEARKLLYKEFPEHYRWIIGQNVWQKRKTQRGQVGRVVYAHPGEGERYNLRVLLNHVRGATSFEDLRTMSGTTYSTFREACEKRGLVETDKSHDDCLNEASTFQMPSALRQLFATILVFCEVTDIRALWDNHKATMSEDYSRGNTNPAAVEQMVLRDIRDLLHSMGNDITEYGLLEISDIGERTNDVMTEIIEELNVLVDQDHLDIYTSLNDEQRAGFDEIIDNRSYLWENIRKIRLSRNMRAQSNPWFSEYLLRIGNGTENTIRDDYVRLPDEIVIAYGDSEDSVH